MAGDDYSSMKGPEHEQVIVDRIPACQLDLQWHFCGLMDKAISAGWTRTEAAIAITQLADDYLLSRLPPNYLNKQSSGPRAMTKRASVRRRRAS